MFQPAECFQLGVSRGSTQQYCSFSYSLGLRNWLLCPSHFRKCWNSNIR